MTIVNTDQIVEDYLARLTAAAAGLPPDRRAELVTEIREHVRDALRESGSHDEVSVRNVLERLGPPEEIATAAAEPAAVGVPPSPAGPTVTQTVLRVVRAALLGLVAFLAVAALAVGGRNRGLVEFVTLSVVAAAAGYFAWRLLAGSRGR